jgi:hypothetical protein
MNRSCSPLFSLCHLERSLRSEGSRASARTAVAVAGHRSVRRDSSLQQLSLRMTQKGECAGLWSMQAPSPAPLARPLPKGEVVWR